MKYMPDFFKSNCKHLLIKVLKSYYVCLGLLKVFSIHRRFREKMTALLFRLTGWWGKAEKFK